MSIENFKVGWTEAPGGALFDLVRGVSYEKAHACSEYGAGLVPVLRANNIVNGKIISENLVYVPIRYVSPEQYLRPGDILIAASSGSRSVVGKSAVATPEHCNFAFGAFCTVARPKTVDAGHWVFSFTQSVEYRAFVESVALGININNLRGSDLKAIPIPIAPLQEQRRIVAKIGSLSLNSKSARNHLDHVPKLVSKYKRAVLAYHFGMQWNGERYVHTLPVRELASIAEIQTGITLGKKRPLGQKLISCPYLRVANVQRGWLALEDIKHVDVTSSEADRLALLPGDILMNEGGDRDKLGRGWVWSAEIPNCIHQNHVFRVRINDSKYPSRFISYFTNEFGQFHFFSEGKQTTNLASISKSKLSTLLVPFPAAHDAVCLTDRIESSFTWIDRLAAEATSARKLIDCLDQAILSKAFRGELVPHDPNDEPASVLLERIKAEKAEAALPRKGRGRPRTVSA